MSKDKLAKLLALNNVTNPNNDTSVPKKVEELEKSEAHTNIQIDAMWEVVELLLLGDDLDEEDSI